MTLRIDGIDELIEKVTLVSKLRRVAAIMKAAAVTLKGKLSKYPPKNRPKRADVYGTTWASAKQAYFMRAAMESGQIEVPYRRGQSPGSQAFGRSWTIASEDDGLTQVIGNDASYGPYLMGPEGTEPHQSEYMAAVGWKTTDVVIEENKDLIVSKVKQALEEELSQ